MAPPSPGSPDRQGEEEKYNSNLRKPAVPPPCLIVKDLQDSSNRPILKPPGNSSLEVMLIFFFLISHPPTTSIAPCFLLHWCSSFQADMKGLDIIHPAVLAS